jgi:hypothetical protein
MHQPKTPLRLMPRKAAFFFGSGISLASFPRVASAVGSTNVASVAGITNSVFNDDWHYTSIGIFLHGPNPNPLIPDDVTPVAKAFLEKVRACAEDYLAQLASALPPRAAHYEDLFSLAEQASRTETDHVPNLAVLEFTRRLRRETQGLYAAFKNPVAGSDNFAKLAEISCDLLHWAVDHTLNRRAGPRKGLTLVAETAQNVDALDIFTLNHDTLVEQELKATAGFGHEAGFGDRSHGPFSVFQPGWATKPRKERTRIFKLHGSLNWFNFDFPGWARQYAIADGDPYGGRDQNGNIVNPVDWKAAFLSGTVVKEQRYGLGFWDDLFSGFRDHLSQHRYIIFCGYSFSDPGVNLRIIQWAHLMSGPNFLVILTPDDEATYLSDKPLWLLNLYRAGRIKFVRKYLQDCSLPDLIPYFENSP